jgi:short-chain fatty acids transporter
VVLGAIYLYGLFEAKGLLAAVDLNNYNFAFLIAGMLLHWTPRSYLRAAGKAVPMTSGVLLQFPLYAGIFGVLVGSGLTEVLAKFFVSISTQQTLPFVIGVYSAILGLFLPSGGGKWIVEAPYVLEAANQLKVNLGWMVLVYNAAEALPNFINPFWMLPLLAVLGLKARDIIGYTFLQFLAHVPVVLFLLWVLAGTLTYMPPTVP